MMLTLHILVALSSLALAGYAFIAPSLVKVYASYALTVLTFLSGAYLIVQTRAHMLEACVMGLAYIGVTLALTLRAQQKVTDSK